jgi:hypothetical protein
VVSASLKMGFSPTIIWLKPLDLDHIFYFGLKPFLFLTADHALKGVAIE